MIIHQALMRVWHFSGVETQVNRQAEVVKTSLMHGTSAS